MISLSGNVWRAHLGAYAFVNISNQDNHVHAAINATAVDFATHGADFVVQIAEY